MTSRIAVTGATGFVGGHVVDRLQELGYDVVPFGRRPRDRVHRDWHHDYVRWDIESGPLSGAPEVDSVVHCAGAVHEWASAAPFHRGNVLGTRNVLATWPGVRFVHVSSASIYDPWDDHSGIEESAADPTDRGAIDRVRWLTEYGRTKRLAEHEVVSTAPNYTILRPHAVYGPNDTQLLPLLLRQYRLGCLIVAGAPDTRISLTSVYNLADAVACAVRSDRVGVYNVSDPEPISLREAFEAVLRTMGLRPRVLFVPMPFAWGLAHMVEVASLYGRLFRPTQSRYKLSHFAGDFVLDTTRARKELGWVAGIDTPTGLLTVGLEA